ncbi:peptide chain release factor 2 [Megasphaera hominis]|nr:peptide chain release factor 2 [Megasphaera hominis]
MVILVLLEEMRKPLEDLKKRIQEIGDSLNLAKKKDRIMDLDMQMSDPDFWNDPDKARKISQEATLLKTEVEGHEELATKAADLLDYLEIAMEEKESDLAGEIEEQYNALLKEIERREVLLLLSGEYDTCNAILTFHAGAGGTEAQDWTQMLVRMYTRWAEQHGFKINVMDMQPGDEAGIKSAAFTIEGEYAYGYLKSEKGVHRLVRISPFDAAARRHTSFTAVDVMPELPDDVDIEINMDDVRVDYFRASGAGGQHVNKTSSAVRMTHIPTGIVVQCQNERSQVQNREMCMKYLRARLFELEQEKQAQLKAEIGGEHQAIEWGSQIRSYVFHPYTLVKDHRTNVETGNIQAVMDGNLDMFIEGFLQQQKEKRLAKQSI